MESRLAEPLPVERTLHAPIVAAVKSASGTTTIKSLFIVISRAPIEEGFPKAPHSPADLGTRFSCRIGGKRCAFEIRTVSGVCGQVNDAEISAGSGEIF